MSKQYLNSVQKLFKYFIFLLFVSNLHASKIIDIKEYLSDIEIVSKYEDRKKGLMNRSSIPNDYGMLFIWPYERKQCMWMKNTSIPLSIAFIKEEGVISDIYNLYPFSTLSVCSTEKVKYALEVNRGWFKENEITRGDTVISSQIK